LTRKLEAATLAAAMRMSTVFEVPVPAERVAAY
jgi:hypothetical protein